MSLPFQRQHLTDFVITWDGLHRQADEDLLCTTRITQKRIGTLPRAESDASWGGARGRACACGRWCLSGRTQCWQCTKAEG